ncbi:MAG: glycosyltransferase family 39 protein, partial [Candidatus Andersenbacteria bacterium]
LYDAKILSQGKIPAGDIITKAPVPALLFATSVFLTHNSLNANRAVSFLANILTAFPLLFIANYLSGKRALIVTILLWLLTTPISMQMLGTTESIAVFFATAALASILKKKYMLFGILLALAFASRKTGIAILMPAIYLLTLSPRSSRTQAITRIIFGSFCVLAPLLYVSHTLYGADGMQELLGTGYAHIITTSTSAAILHQDIFSIFAVLTRISSGLLFILAISFLWLIKDTKKNISLLAIPLFWILGLLALYATWPTFLPEYATDFLPAIVLVCALTLSNILVKITIQNIGIVLLFAILTCTSLWSSYMHPWTGMFTRKAIYETAHQLQQYVPSNSPIFTAAVIIPYVSGHSVFKNISHPLWYAYPFIPEQKKNLYLPPRALVETAVITGTVHFALIEQLTDYAYLRSSSRLISLFGTTWQLRNTVQNITGFRSNTLKLFEYNR